MSRLFVAIVLATIALECSWGFDSEGAIISEKSESKAPEVLPDLEVKTSKPTVNISVPIEKETVKNKTQEIVIIQPDLRSLNEPALRRLFYVLLGLSTVTVCYVALKMYRVRKGVTRPTHVRKYGVLTQRSDIEMEPLHLDDDEEDDTTVFDVGAHTANR